MLNPALVVLVGSFVSFGDADNVDYQNLVENIVKNSVSADFNSTSSAFVNQFFVTVRARIVG